MTKITINSDCGNAPKKEFLKNINRAFAEGDVAFLTDSVTDDIVWTLVGAKTIVGKKSFLEALERMKTEQIEALILNQIVTHGKEAAANGFIIKSDGTKYAFADFYEFQGAKGTHLKGIMSYLVQLSE